MDRGYGAHIEALPHRGTLPAFSALVGDAAGNVWLAQYPVPGAKDRRWIVIDSTFSAVARIELPAGADVLGYGDDLLLTSTQDEMGRHSVALYRIVR
jgi:hypothetical protein